MKAVKFIIFKKINFNGISILISKFMKFQNRKIEISNLRK